MDTDWPENIEDREMQATRDFLDKWLSIAEESGVHIDVIISAMEVLKRNPSLSIIDAIKIGLEEWDVSDFFFSD